METYCGIDGKKFSRQYKDKLSDFKHWEFASHAENYLIYPDNIGTHLGLDETSVSNGELYTILSNKSKKGKKGSIVGIFKGTKTSEIIPLIKKYIPKEKRDEVEQISVDMAGNMNLIVKQCFLKAEAVIDRFHVQKLVSEAIQELRIKHRWEVLKNENEAYRTAKENGNVHVPNILENGDTERQLLARSRYLLYKSHDDWTESQVIRAKILFEKFPDIEKAYYLADQLRRIYNQNIDPDNARLKLARWFNEVETSEFESFNTIRKTFETHNRAIVNYFISRQTNAFAECLNAKIKDFRRALRGVVDIKYFLFRLTKIYA